MANYLYNGEELSKLPDSENSYAYILKGWLSGARYLYLSTVPMTVEAGTNTHYLYATSDGSVTRYSATDDGSEWVYAETVTLSAGDKIGSAAMRMIWSNTDVYLYDDETTLYLAASTPIPVLTDLISIELYSMTEERIVFPKSPTLISTLTGNLREQTDISNPVVNIEQSTLPTFNYVYIPSFNRYYFVEEVVSVRTGLWRISLHVDVLNSFSGGVLKCSGLVDRNENDYNPRIIDKVAVVEQGVHVEEIAGDVVVAPVGSEYSDTKCQYLVTGAYIKAGSW